MALRFTLEDAQRAWEDWGANCGPGALAAVTDRTLDEVRPHLRDFDGKGYTNPTMMLEALRSLEVRFVVSRDRDWPGFGLARIQWEGPWTRPGVPMRARYRHTHWVGVLLGGTSIFDINAMCAGGWIPVREWAGQLVPWLLREVEPKADGRWHITHAVDILP